MAHAHNQEQDDRPYLVRLIRSRYTVIIGVLAVITLIELAIAGTMEGSQIGIVLLATLSIAKMVLVAMYYMHLYGDNPVFTAVFLVPVPFVALIVAALVVQFVAP